MSSRDQNGDITNEITRLRHTLSERDEQWSLKLAEAI